MTDVTGTRRAELRAAWQEARRLAAHQGGTLGLGVGLMLVNRGAALALPIGSKFFIDEVVGHGRASALAPLVVCTAGAVVAQAFAALTLSRVCGVTAARAVTELRAELGSHVIRLPMVALERISIGTLITRLTSDTEQVGAMLTTGLMPFASGGLTALIALVVLATVSIPAAVALTVALTVAILLLAGGFARYAGAFAEVGIAAAALTDRLSESLSAIAVVKACAAEPRETNGLIRAAHRHLRAVVGTVRVGALLGATSTILTGFGAVALLAIGGSAVRSHAITLGDLTMMAMLVGLLAAPVAHIAALGREVGEAIAALTRLSRLRALKTEDQRHWVTSNRPVDACRGAVAVERVHYSYPCGAVALCDISFTARPGTITALVGRSGSGKSTICRLLLALDNPTRGRVLIHGQDVATVRPRDLRAQIGSVLQDDKLFATTVADNIRLARPCASDADVRRAARLANCEEFVESLPKGYATLLGPQGTTLSGGQRQRLAIARAILTDARILVLDEPTSGLDAGAEVLVRDTLIGLRDGRTIIVITHRLSTAQHADQILVLSAGAVVERGTHTGLLAEKGHYHALWAAQQATPTHWPDEIVPPMALDVRATWGRAGHACAIAS